MKSPLFHSHIGTSPGVCTSILVDRFLSGKYRLWTLVAAFGDNLHASAFYIAESLKLEAQQAEKLWELGELINCNAYGETIDDLYFSTKSLFLALHTFTDPFEFIQSSGELKQLREGFQSNMCKA